MYTELLRMTGDKRSKSQSQSSNRQDITLCEFPLSESFQDGKIFKTALRYNQSIYRNKYSGKSTESKYNKIDIVSTRDGKEYSFLLSLNAFKFLAECVRQDFEERNKLTNPLNGIQRTFNRNSYDETSQRNFTYTVLNDNQSIFTNSDIHRVFGITLGFDDLKSISELEPKLRYLLKWDNKAYSDLNKLNNDLETLYILTLSEKIEQLMKNNVCTDTLEHDSNSMTCNGLFNNRPDKEDLVVQGMIDEFVDNTFRKRVTYLAKLLNFSEQNIATFMNERWLAFKGYKNEIIRRVGSTIDIMGDNESFKPIFEGLT